MPGGRVSVRVDSLSPTTGLHLWQLTLHSHAAGQTLQSALSCVCFTPFLILYLRYDVPHQIYCRSFSLSSFIGLLLHREVFMRVNLLPLLLSVPASNRTEA